MRNLLILAGLCLVAGCGSEAVYEKVGYDEANYQPPQTKMIDDSGSLAGREDVLDLTTRNVELAQAEGEPPAVPEVVSRRIIYTATVSLVVQKFEEAEQKLPELIKQHGGYVSSMTLGRAAHQQRSGSWTARIPVDKFDAFVDGLSELGYPESRSQNSQDVTDQYVDLEARIANNKRLEERVLKLLDERSGKIGEVIEVERELARIRQQIEQMEGKLRQLANLTSLSTVTINVREELNYTPPEAPTFATRASNGWTNSISALADTGQNVAIMVVVAFPWLVVMAIIAAPVVLLVRRKIRQEIARRKAMLAATLPPDAPAS